MEQLSIFFFLKRDQAKSTSVKLYFSKSFLLPIEQTKFYIFTGKTPLAVTKFHEDERKLQVLDSPSPPLQNLISLSLTVRISRIDSFQFL